MKEESSEATDRKSVGGADQPQEGRNGWVALGLRTINHHRHHHKEDLTARKGYNARDYTKKDLKNEGLDLSHHGHRRREGFRQH